jgi:branched-chain amino acid transport system substrate-binding protein
VTNYEKSKGIEEFSANNYFDAINHFELSLEEKPDDPETLIYLNNAVSFLKERSSNIESFEIAVSVPISGDLGFAEEVLRGVAQLQNEVNASERKVDDKFLRILIADDKGTVDGADSIANSIVKDPSILAVIGHFSSDLTKVASAVYGSKGLVSISPSATSTDLSGYSEYFFRTATNDEIAAEQLASYLVENTKFNRFAIAYDGESDYSISFKEAFEKKVGESALFECVLDNLGFDSERDCTAKLNNNPVEVFLFVPSIQNTILQALS